MKKDKLELISFALLSRLQASLKHVDCWTSQNWNYSWLKLSSCRDFSPRRHAWCRHRNVFCKYTKLLLLHPFNGLFPGQPW